MSTPKLGKKYQKDDLKVDMFVNAVEYEYADYDDYYDEYDPNQEYNIEVRF